jgi:hypothetical protein
MSIAILALSELFSGCACALTLPSPASFRRVSDKRSALDLLDNVFLLHFALKRRSAFSRDSPSCSLTSANRTTPPNSSKWTR